MQACASIIIPFHNRFNLVRRAVACVCQQTYRPIELILVDDRSDASFELALPCPSDSIDIHLIRLERNSGPGAAREAGRRRASGEYIAYLDSDDYWSPAFLATMIQALSCHSDAGMAYCTAMDVEDDEVKGICKQSHETHNDLMPTVLYGRPWHTSSCVWRREATDRIGAWLPLWNREDYEYDCRAGCLGIKIVHVGECLCYVQRDAPHRVSVVEKDARKVLSNCVALREMARCINRTEWRRQSPVRSRICYLAYSNAIDTARLNLVFLSLSNLYLGWRWTHDLKSRLLYGIPTLVAGGLLILRQWNRGIKLLRWIRRVSVT